MATMWFQNRKGEERVIAQVETWDDVYAEIDKFIENCNKNKIEQSKKIYGDQYDESKVRFFKSYYTRIWEEGGRTKLDVGSWTEFFYTDLKPQGM